MERYNLFWKVVFQNKNKSDETSTGEQEKVSGIKPINHRRRESLDFMTEHGISYEDGRLNW